MKKLIFIFTIFKGIDKLKFLFLIIKIKYYWLTDKNLIYTNSKVYRYTLLYNGQCKNVHLRMQDVATFFEIFFKEIYKIVIPECNTIVDLGAHIGLTTLYFEMHYPDAKIYSFEPEEANFEILSINACSAKISKLAISNKQGIAMLAMEAIGVNHHLGEVGKKIETTTLMAIIEKCNIHKIDLLKIDIEGAETLMFESIDDWKHKVKNLIMECHGNENEIISMLQDTDINFNIV